MTEDRIARHVIVRGVVQGVFFRASCQEQARRAGVAGWVRNRADGSVEAHLEGPASAVEQLVAWCHEGPSRARVESVDVAPASPAGVADFTTRG